MQQKILSPITDSYSAKGENLMTLKMFHRGENMAIVQGQHFTNYGFAFQVVFPIVVMFFLSLLSHHLVENDSKGFFKKLRNVLEQPNGNANQEDDNIHDMDSIKVSTRNMYIVILVICSVTFVVYVIVLDIVAIIDRNTKVSSEIFFKLNQNESKYGDVSLAFELEYSIPLLMLAYDLLIFAAMVVGMICKRCGVRKGKWYHIGIAPASCIVVHSYHILIGFIQSPHHAASIFIFYAVTVFIFYVTFKAAYYNLFEMRQRFKINNRKMIKFWTWECCCPEYTLPYPVVLTIMSLISLFLSGFMVFVVGLFVIIPINMAIDNAPARLFSINQTVLVFIGAAITYKLYRNHAGANNIIEQLVKANREYLATNGIDGELRAWKDLDKVDKEIKMGKLMIAALHTINAPALQPAPALQQQGPQQPAPALQQQGPPSNQLQLGSNNVRNRHKL